MVGFDISGQITAQGDGGEGGNTVVGGMLDTVLLKYRCRSALKSFRDIFSSQNIRRKTGANTQPDVRKEAVKCRADAAIKAHSPLP